MKKIIVFLIVLFICTLEIFPQKISQLKPELVLPIGHTGSVISIVFSPDNKLIGTVSGGLAGDNSIKIWDTQSGKMLRTLKGNNQAEYAAFSSDGTLICSVSSEVSIAEIWDTRSGKMIYSLDISMELGSAESVKFCNNDNWIAVTFSINNSELTKTAVIWDINTSEKVQPSVNLIEEIKIPYLYLNNDFINIDNWKHEEGYNLSFISPSGLLVATTNIQSDTKIRDIYSGKIICTIKSVNPYTISFSPDSKWIITEDSLIRIWDSQKGTLLSEIPEFRRSNTLFFSNDGKKAVIQPNDSTFEIWDVRERKKLFSYAGRYATFSSDSKRIIVTGNASAFIYSVETGDIIQCLRDFYSKSPIFSLDGRLIITEPDEERYRKITISPERKIIIYQPDDWIDRTSNIWDIEKGEKIESFKGLKRWDGVPGTISPDGKWVACRSHYAVEIYDVHTGKMVNKLVGNTQRSLSGLFSPDGSMILKVSEDGMVQIWDIRSGKIIHCFKTDNFTKLARYSPDSRMIMTDSESDSLKIWDILTGKLIKSTGYSGGAIGESVFSPDAKKVLIYDEKRVYIWEIETGKLIQSPDIHTKKITSALFSPDSKKIITGSYDATAKILDSQTGEILHSLDGHYFNINSAIFSNDSKNAVTTTWDEVIRIWNSEKGQIYKSFKGISGVAQRAVFSPNDSLIAVESNNGNVIVWNIQSEKRLCEYEDAEFINFSTDGRKIISSGGKEIKVWDVNTCKLLNTFTVDIDETNTYDRLDNAVDFQKGRIFTQQNSVLTLHDLYTGQKLLSWIAIDSTDWAVITPSGLFDASPGAMQKMYFVQGLEVIGLEQLKDRYYEPELWSKVMGFNKEPLRQVDSLQTLDLYPEIRTFPIDDGLLYVDLYDRGGGIGKVIITINNKEIDLVPENRIETPAASNTVIFRSGEGKPTGDNTSGTAGKVELTYNLKDHPYLLPGVENLIEVKAYNKDNWLISGGIKESYTPKAPKVIAPPDLYSIIAGASDYRGAYLDLGFASKDAADFAEVLRSGADRLFGVGNTFIALLNTDGKAENFPTRTNLKKAVEDIAGKAKSGDIFIFYLAGHGTNWGGQDGDFYYLTPDASDGNLNDPAIRNSVAVSGTEIARWFREIAALKQVLIMDVCHSGKLADDFMGSRGDVSSSVVRSYERMKDRTGMYILAGSAADAVSYETSIYGQGLLTYSLIFGMKGAALRDDEFIDVMKLFQHSADQVPQLAQGIGGIQRPQIRTPYGGQSFDIGRLTHEDQSKIILKAPKPMFLRSSFQDDEQMDDVLSINDALDSQLRDLSSREGDIKIVFIDASHFSEAYKITGRYISSNGKITANIVLRKGDNLISRFTLEADKKEELVKRIAEEAMKIAKN